MADDDAPALDTLAIHAAQPPDPGTGAVMPPIVLASTFAQPSPGRPGAYEYGRTGNPTRHALEACMAALEGGRHGLALGSGCAAMHLVLQTLVPGDHVVASHDVYGGTFRLLERVMAPLGIATTWVDMQEPERVAEVLRPSTRLVWVESPTNPMLEVIDIARVAELVHRQPGVRVVVDNTFATPVLQRPLALGADAVVHSTTKYVNGHSDVVGGAVVTDDDSFAERLRFFQNAGGAVPSPFDCFLVLRGIKTLPVRMRRHCESAGELARWLEARPEVERVFYPGLPRHRGHAVARQQMAGFGGMISMVVRGGLEASRRFLETTRLFTLAESLGGVESLIEHPALMTHGSVPRETREKAGIVDGLVRLSVGLEGVEDLKADLDRALVAASRV